MQSLSKYLNYRIFPIRSAVDSGHLDLSRVDPVQENLTLKSQPAAVTAKQDLVAKTIRIFGFQIQYKRLPSADAKIEIIAAIKAAADIISLHTCLSVIGLTAARYHHWLKRIVRCLLND